LAPAEDEPDSVRLESGVKGADNGLKAGNVDAPADAGGTVAGTDDTGGMLLGDAMLAGAPAPAGAPPDDAPPAAWPGGVPPTPRPGALPDFPCACTPCSIMHSKISNNFFIGYAPRLRREQAPYPQSRMIPKIMGNRSRGP
jgi:hypothetical protein